MRGRAGVLWTIAAFALAAPVAAQTGFDGTYAGVSTQVTKTVPEAANCPRGGVPTSFVVANGVVAPPAGRKGWTGTVSAQGAVTMQNQYAMHVEARIDPQGNVVGQYSGPQCIVKYLWRKQPA